MGWMKRFFSFRWLRKRKKVPKIKEPSGVGLTCPENLVDHYAMLWFNCDVTGEVESVIKRIKDNKERYLKGQELSGVPWYIIAAIHNMEASGRFNRNMVNGQRIDRRTTIVPKGLGPWDCWEDSVKEAFDRRKLPLVWNVANTLYFLEKYNGTGYLRFHKDVNSPYLWSKTSNYKRGKYTSDGSWSSTAVSKQVGAVAIMKKLNVELNVSDSEV